MDVSYLPHIVYPISVRLLLLTIR